MFRTIGTIALTLMLAQGAVAQEREKLTDDPTKIITKVTLRYTDKFTLAGSIAFGPVSKVNLSISEGEEWSVGGSYLFQRLGIVNIAAGRRELSNGVDQTRYSIGGFVPFAAFGFAPGGWQFFGAYGYTHTEGTVTVVPAYSDVAQEISTTSDGGYLGFMALKPLSDRWTLRGGAIVSAGSNDYTGYSLGGGVSYALTDRINFGVFGGYTDNSFGDDQVTGASLTYEF